MTRTYNADDSDEGAFGRSWTFNYEVELVEEPGGDVNIKRESGKMDFFNSLGGGTYSPPLWSHDVLVKNANGTWDLRVKRTRLTQHFDTQGRLTSITDRNGNAVTLQYDANGRVQTVADAVGRFTTFFYGANSKINRVADPAGREATYTYDANNNLVGTTDMVGNVVMYTYDQNSYMSSLVVPKGTYKIVNVPYTEATFGLVVSSITDPLGHTKSYSTPGDALGNAIVEVLDANGNAWNYLPVGNGEVPEITDPLGNKTKFTFTPFGDRTSISDPKGNRIDLTYDPRGNITSIKDPLLNTVTLAYDSRDNLTSLQDPLKRIYQYAYDTKDNLTKVTDPKGGITSFAYDSFGQLTSLSDPRGNVTAFAYDNQGNLKTMATPLGRLTSYNYDAIGRMISVTTPKGDTINYSYDGIDRITRIDYPDGNTALYTYECCNLIRVADRSGTLNFVYDQANRMATYSDVFGKTIQYGYDNVGNLTALSYQDGKLVTYGYDKGNRLTSVTDWLGNTVAYDYDPASNLTSSRTSSGMVTAYQYDNANRMIGLANGKPDGSLLSYYKYTLDALGNRITIAAQEPLSPALQLEAVTSNYDPDNQIISANARTFVHDDNGNLISETQGANVKTYSYDLNDRLIQVIANGQTTQYQYDGLGYRLSKAVGSSVTRYALDPNGVLSNVLGETDTNGNFTSYYVYGLGLLSKITPDGQTFFSEYDGLGSTIAMTDVSGNVVNKYAYDPFGNLSGNFTETIPNPFRYVGRYGVMDEGNELLFMRARYYATNIGRFINKDPIGFSGGINLYAYANDDPVNGVDPRGELVFLLAATPIWVVITALLMAGVSLWSFWYYSGGAQWIQLQQGRLCPPFSSGIAIPSDWIPPWYVAPVPSQWPNEPPGRPNTSRAPASASPPRPKL